MVQYKYIGKSNKDCFYIKGTDLFRKQWKTVGDCAIVMDPATQKTYGFSVYEIEWGNKTLKFVAGKNGSDEWLFFDADN